MSAPAHVGAAGIALIKRFEGLRTEAYRDSAGIWTIGYGHAGTDVRPGQRIDPAQAETLLHADLAAAAAAVAALVKVPLRQTSFDALVSFAFNLGAAALAGSHLLRRLNAGDEAGAADEFGRWCVAGGRPLPGLARRRAAERELFLSREEDPCAA